MTSILNLSSVRLSVHLAVCHVFSPKQQIFISLTKIKIMPQNLHDMILGLSQGHPWPQGRPHPPSFPSGRPQSPPSTPLLDTHFQIILSALHFTSSHWILWHQAVTTMSYFLTLDIMACITLSWILTKVNIYLSQKYSRDAIYMTPRLQDSKTQN